MKMIKGDARRPNLLRPNEIEDEGERVKVKVTARKEKCGSPAEEGH